jgi:hypothetical protein
MSLSAPWFSMASDWVFSEMFDDLGDDERYLWALILTHAKSFGRSGKVKCDYKTLVRQYKTTRSEESYNLLLDRAECHGALKREDGSVIYITNWDYYQNKRTKPKTPAKNDTCGENTLCGESGEIPATPANPANVSFPAIAAISATHHTSPPPPPTTHHQPHITPHPPPSSSGGDGLGEVLDEFPEAVQSKAAEINVAYCQRRFRKTPDYRKAQARKDVHAIAFRVHHLPRAAAVLESHFAQPPPDSDPDETIYEIFDRYGLRLDVKATPALPTASDMLKLINREDVA